MLRADTHSDRMEQEKSKAFDPSVQALRFAMNAIKQHRFDDAYHWLLQAASVDMENSEIFNLLGILYEKKAIGSRRANFTEFRTIWIRPFPLHPKTYIGSAISFIAEPPESNGARKESEVKPNAGCNSMRRTYRSGIAGLSLYALFTGDKK